MRSRLSRFAFSPCFSGLPLSHQRFSPLPKVSRPSRRLSARSESRKDCWPQLQICVGEDKHHSEPQVTEQEGERKHPIISSSEFAFTLTLFITATAGGPVIATWGLLFLALGRYTGTPPWLQTLSTFLFAGITDALCYNWTNSSLDSGFAPFLVLFLGSGATAFFSPSSFFSSIEFNPRGVLNPTVKSTELASQHAVIKRTEKKTYDEFADWDRAIKETSPDKDTAS